MAENAIDDPGGVPAGIDISVPNVARVYDSLLGGKDNFAADASGSGPIA